MQQYSVQKGTLYVMVKLGRHDLCFIFSVQEKKEGKQKIQFRIAVTKIDEQKHRGIKFL